MYQFLKQNKNKQKLGRGGSKVFSFADRNNSQKLNIFSTTSERLKIKQPWKSKTFCLLFPVLPSFRLARPLELWSALPGKKPRNNLIFFITDNLARQRWAEARAPDGNTTHQPTGSVTNRPVQWQTDQSRDKQTLSAADSAETAVRYPNKVYPSSNVAAMTLSVNPSVRQYVHRHVNRHHDVVCKSFCCSVRQYVHRHVNRHHDVCKSFCQTIMYTLPCKSTL